MKCGFFFVVYEHLALVALTVAQTLRLQSDADIHIFIEDPAASEHPGFENDRIYVHRNQLSQFLPTGMPSSHYWPEIVYLRIFAPLMLGEYDRLLYLDADIIPLTQVHPDIWTTQLKGPLGAVLDFGAIEDSPIKKLSKREWLQGLGIQSDTYFNSGVMLIDVASWLKIDFGAQLKVFVDQHRSAITMFDQDFLNWLLQDQWTDLGPAWNFQASLFGFGLEYLLTPVFLHFSKPEKPWLRQHHLTIVDLDKVGSDVFTRMSNQCHIDLSHLVRPKRLSAIARFRYAIREKFSLRGYRTKKERLLRLAWDKRRRAVIHYVLDPSHQFAASTNPASLDLALSVEPVFDGKNLRFPATDRMKTLLAYEG